jgi:hypothetical protein
MVVVVLVALILVRRERQVQLEVRAAVAMEALVPQLLATQIQEEEAVGVIIFLVRVVQGL